MEEKMCKLLDQIHLNVDVETKFQVPAQKKYLGQRERFGSHQMPLLLLLILFRITAIAIVDYDVLKVVERRLF